MDTLGHQSALRVSAASEQDRAQVRRLAKDVQEAAGDPVTLAYVDQGYTGEETAMDAAERGIQLHLVSLPQASTTSPSRASRCGTSRRRRERWREVHDTL